MAFRSRIRRDSLSKSSTKGSVTAPQISACDREDMCSRQARPASDSCTPSMSLNTCEPVSQKSPGV